ncbi:MAG: hypothetical protein S0880_21145 [Actinomycetota bacterium]|nr:hypothetical protein [Actinomycetota bacterium]
MLGEHAQWVKNARAAGGRAAIRHKGRTEVRPHEIPVGERPPVRAYLAQAPGARPHMPVDKDAPVEAFATVADRFPAFEIETIAA